ncbi:helitron_like_N domain-containing protein [Trichonephila clavata]|uniref:Helitron_like_N domain-containing protein n=1 Tax=Trichonephila clavata TaxID=2740835 RepID=A0A8X6FKC5_TRICU|nr:helitron_like_N domain-containing protein [Trichonephila clavata]
MITNVDGYPIYRQRNTNKGEQSFTKCINNADIDIDNCWVVPYSPLLSKTFNAHINIEFCKSVKSIKYICNSDEAVWRIFGFQIHERDPAVVHLTVHLENDQLVFFTNETVIDRAINPSKTTLNEFFELCNHADAFGAFARKLLYSEVPRYFLQGLKQKNGCPASKRFRVVESVQSKSKSTLKGYCRKKIN